jgi:GTP-binding protein
MEIIIKKTEFKGSFKNIDQCPKIEIPEFAFIGRSNVGKSSLINMLCGRKDIVKVSNKPGKTQSLNYFLINSAFHFVDLPGYGYARVSKQERKEWEQMIGNFLPNRKQLACVFQLIDSRIEPQLNDIEFSNRLGEWQIPFVLVFTKSDKQSYGATSATILKYQKELKKTWEAVPRAIITSAETRFGKEELLTFIFNTM